MTPVPNPHLYPHQGYRFTALDGGEFTSSSWALLAEAVRDHRKANGVPVGEPLEEVYRMACAREPSLCGSPAGVLPETPPGIRLAREESEWLLKVRLADAGGSLSWVSEEEATSRAKVCRVCPSNMKPIGGCGSCLTTAKAATRELRGSGPQVNPEGLFACVSFGMHVETACRLKLGPLDAPAEAPAGCWRVLIA